MKPIVSRLSILSILLSAAIIIGCSSQKEDDRVEELLRQMTLEEKIGQMMQGCLSTITADGTKTLHLDEARAREVVLEHHAGSFISGSGTAQEWIDFCTRLQKIAVEESRLGIPLLLAIDHIHGANYVSDGTILPHSINLACTFDTALVRKVARITAAETAILGIRWNFAPVLDLGKNPYWPRFYETFGEDPMVCASLGRSFISETMEFGDRSPYRIATCAKHFVGYSDPKSGWDRTPSEIPQQILFESFLPPFQAAIDAGVPAVMLNSGELNGRPVHTSKWLVSKVLRSHMGFEGLVLTDIKDILKVVEMHAGAANEKEATLAAIHAGIDMSMSCDSYRFLEIVKALVEEGHISEERIDRSVRKVLQLKFDLNLFDHPYPLQDSQGLIGCREHKEAAVEIAARSVVLMKNEGLLPLQKSGQRILITGHAAHSRRVINGAWTFEWLGAAEERQPGDMSTLFQAIQKEFGNDRVSFFPFLDEEFDPIIFQQSTKRCDVILVTAGEYPYSEFKGNISDLSLPGSQQSLIRAAIETGKPVVLILVEGRPRLIHEFAGKVNSIVFAGLPGSGGPEAIAGILSGRINPSGKLAFTYPSQPGHLVPYNHKPSDLYQCEFPFGHGLSYNDFSYRRMTVSDTVVSRSTDVSLEIEVANTGKRAGRETVFLFIRDKVGSITRPVKKLIGFNTIDLQPGESGMVSFTVNPQLHLSFPDREGKKILEKGDFTLSCGGLEQRITLN